MLRLYGSMCLWSLWAALTHAALNICCAAQADFDNDVHNSLDNASDYHDAWFR